MWKLAALALLVQGWAGCSSGPGRSAAFTTSGMVSAGSRTYYATPTNAAPAPPAPAAPAPEPLTPPPLVAAPAPVVPVTPIVVPPTEAAWPTNWVNAWVPLESWGQFNGLAKPASLTPQAGTTSPSFQFRTTNGGTLTVKMGSRVAWSDGLECWLGFAPQLIKGVPYIHSSDAQKSFQPLLKPFAQAGKPPRVIVLDPGHGGKDSGTKSCLNNEYEKHYTLDWARRLERLLVTNGWQVVLTRTNDSEISLSNRVAVADRVNADLFLSLHFNSGTPNPELAGLETYCLTPVGMPSNLLRAYEDDPQQCFPNNAFDEENLQYAVNLHRGLVRATNATDRGVRRARFMGVLRGQKRPAVLIEGGYLSNPKEARKIATSTYRQTMAEAVARALE